MNASPSIVPGIEHDVCLVLDDFGRMDRAWRETDVEDTDFETVIRDLLNGQYRKPVRVVAFNTAEGWSRDISEVVALELRARCADQDREVPEFLTKFVQRYEQPTYGEEMTFVGGVFIVKTDRDVIIRALEEAQRILAEHFEPGKIRHDASTIHRLVTVLDRPEMVAALKRMKTSRGLQLVK